MPKVYRAMTPARDEKPLVIQTGRGLGVRVPDDVRPDGEGNVTSDSGGMSVAPTWRDLPTHRIPPRLKGRLNRLEKDAAGKDTDRCWTCGEGAFNRAPVLSGLLLVPDEPMALDSPHGVVAAENKISLAEFRSALEKTREHWIVDEE